MGLSREERKLLHQKSKQPTFGIGKPAKGEGYDGDISFRKVEGSGTVEYVKESGDWKAVASSGEMPVIRIVGGTASVRTSSSSGVTDHGALTGRGDDDHTQYILHSLADAANDFYVASGANTMVKKTLAETGAILEGDIQHDNLQGVTSDEHLASATFVKHSQVTAASDFLVASGSGVVVKKTLAETGAILEDDLDHGNIQGLEDDDHPKYILHDGTRALTANWDVGAFDISAEQFHSDIDVGTSPFTVVSTTVVANLNADRIDSIDGAEILQRDGSIPLTANWDAGSFDITAEQLHSDIDIGTSPFTVVSTTEVALLNVAALSGADWDAPLDIGGTTPANAYFTDLDVDGVTTLDQTTIDVTDGNFTVNGSTNTMNIDVRADFDLGVTMDQVTIDTTDGAFSVDGTNGTTINSTGAALGIGTDADAFPIDIGTGASARTITIGNDASTKVDIDALIIELDSAGSILLNSTTTTDIDATTTLGFTSGTTMDLQATTNLTIDSSGGSIGMGTDADSFAIDIGTGAAARTITMGNVSGATSLVLNAGTGGIALASTGTGDIELTSSDNITFTSTDVLRFTDGTATFQLGGTGVTTLSGATTIDMDCTSRFKVDSGDSISLDSVTNFNVIVAGNNLIKADSTTGQLYFNGYSQVLYQDYAINNMADKYHFTTGLADFKQNYSFLLSEFSSSDYNTGYGI